MLRSISVLALAITAILVVSCDEDPPEMPLTTNVSMNMQLLYEGEPVVMLQNYEYPTGETFYLSRVSMFVADVKLDDVQLKTEDYYSLTEAHSTTALAAEGFTTVLGEVEEGSYDNLSFAIGVTAENNAMVPGDFTSTHVLSQAGEYWSGWSSYVFYKIEGMLDSDGDGTADQGISLHIGGDEVFTNITLPLGTTIDKDNNVIGVDLDLYDVFNGGGQPYDIVSNSGLHSKDNHLTFMQELIANTKTAMTAR